MPCDVIAIVSETVFNPFIQGGGFIWIVPKPTDNRKKRPPVVERKLRREGIRMERKYTTVKKSAAYTDFFIKREGKIPVLSTFVFC